MTTPDALAALDSILFQLDAIPLDALPDTGRVYGPRMFLSQGTSEIRAALRQSREYLAKPKEEKKGRKRK